MTCRWCGGTFVEVKALGKGMRVQQCDRCQRFNGTPYSLSAKRAVNRQRGRMQRDLDRAMRGDRPRPRAVDFNQPSRSGWTPDLATPRGERD